MRKLLLLTSLASLCLTTLAAHAQVIISVDFYGTSPVEQRLLASDVAGVSPYAAANWNLVSGAASTTDVALVTSTGAATSVFLDSTTLSSGADIGSNGTTPLTGDQKLYDGFMGTDKWWAQPSLNFTVGGLEAFSSYSLVVYLHTAFNGGRSGSMTTNDPFTQTFYFATNVTGNPQPGSPAAYTQVTSTTAGTPTTGNYIVFTGLTADSLTASFTSIDNTHGIAGFQIIGVPEPGAFSLSVLALAGLAIRRRRRG